MRGINRRSLMATLMLTAAVSLAGSAELNHTNVPARSDDRTIVHVLNRIGFGPVPGDVERVRRVGLQAYIEQQLTPERIPDERAQARLAALTTLSKSTRDLATEYYIPAQMERRERQRQQAAQPDPGALPPTPGNQGLAGMPPQSEAMRMERQALGEVMQAKVLRAVYSERQLEEVLVDFWFNHFNVFSGKGQVRMYINEHERDAIRPHVLGKFRDLLTATAHSPAMLFYLDNWQSAAPEGTVTTAANTRRPAPGFGRRNINRPGLRPASPQVRTLADLPPGAQNRRRGLNENYARELMELHTLGVDGGYTQKDVQEVARAFTGWTIANPRQGGGFHFEPRMHDDGEKLVLGRKIHAGGGEKDGADVIALLATHPATARFISMKLARRFVADEPPTALVDRAAARFRETDGNIREVVRTIVTSPEFFAADVRRAKVKTPFEFIVSAVRATRVDLPNGLPIVAAVRNLGMPIYGCQPPTGYADKAEAWVNSGALINRMNFAVSLASSRFAVAGPRPPRERATTAPAVTSDVVIASVLAGEISESTAATIKKAATEPQALALVLGSPEFQRR
ncbi:MAG TPA: DUF1800 domain-containing protein [Vicinamibacterales bacterium]|nr:DUF1800 domain-containing protein [Vicinamibacterales bacterium]